MSDVPETLQQLVRRRLTEMGAQRGRSEPLSLSEAFRRLDTPEVSYELVRRVEKGTHTNIGGPAVRTIATMLDVDENVVRAAAGQRPALGKFDLPSRADQLEHPERQAVLSIIDAILAAGQRSGHTKRSAHGSLSSVPTEDAVPTAAMEPERRGRPPERERPGENTDPYIDG